MKHKDVIPGGLADKKQPKDFDKNQLSKGIKVEMEHTSDKSIAEEIAMDHLTEDPKYYEKLERMERSSFKLNTLIRIANTVDTKGFSKLANDIDQAIDELINSRLI